ncbi:MAG: serine--tRNA ligase [Coxiellaceae bacterium]|jgi:seryl-tRNA synthetase|nr:serine--tRNA ligase [Coxiellaceae bacterium]
MLDARCFRQELIVTAERLKKRGFELDINLIKVLEEERKIIQIETQNLQNERNRYSREIGNAKNMNTDTSSLMIQMHEINIKLETKQKKTDEILMKLHDIYSGIPNLPHESVPNGKNSKDNIEIRCWGELRIFDFTPQDHSTIGIKLGMMDFERASKITGSRFVILFGKLAKLQRALIKFMLDTHVEDHGYQEVYVPNLVNRASLFNTGQLPKFNDDLFNISDSYKYSLIPTAEVPITNLIRGEIIVEEKLPLKYVAHTPCYRSEVGSYGKDIHGIIRQHQFEKVELVRFEKPISSYEAFEELTKHAEKILQKLNLPYRVMSLCDGELGFAAAKTYDLEVWFPSQKKYREISSCSNFESFQTRRLQSRFRSLKSNKIGLLHTLNGSGLAVGRTLAAIIENYQTSNGQICLPEILWDYMDGERIIK